MDPVTIAGIYLGYKVLRGAAKGTKKARAQGRSAAGGFVKGAAGGAVRATGGVALATIGIPPGADELSELV